MVQELENVILEQNLVLHNYVDFAAFDKIDEGSVGIVYKSMWKNKLMVALKCLKINIKPEEKEFQQFVRELQILPKVSQHRNIVKLYGVTKDPSEEYYKIILQFAEDGNLRDYLTKQLSNLKWTDKYRIAKEIALGLEFLHYNNIAHRDLINDATLNSNSAIFGTPAYIEPQCLKDSGYVRNKKSDIFSLGFVLWEISSCRKPFQSFKSACEIQMLIFEGKRETPVNGTPQRYVELYTLCWDDSPEKRPDIKKVLEILNKPFVNDSRYLLP
ncbi:kinase-like protein [Gigaspora margarita]|uniref:Kinase-like protein n=1 Tax=Gigaspora margarita TaxID=4874 RepID=A0A8H4B1J0_GIGMA|nr:kinase-like protein [Gigaspora margarita]